MIATPLLRQVKISVIVTWKIVYFGSDKAPSFSLRKQLRRYHYFTVGDVEHGADSVSPANLCCLQDTTNSLTNSNGSPPSLPGSVRAHATYYR
jgi:hypothetical protein